MLFAGGYSCHNLSFAYNNNLICVVPKNTFCQQSYILSYRSVLVPGEKIFKSYVGDSNSYVGDNNLYIGVSNSYVGDSNSYVRDNKSYVGDSNSYVGDNVLRR